MRLDFTILLACSFLGLAQAAPDKPPQVSAHPHRMQTCQPTEYKNLLFWDNKHKTYWTFEGPWAIPLNTCDKKSCHTMNTQPQEVIINCLARPDNTNNCPVPCHRNKLRPNKSTAARGKGLL